MSSKNSRARFGAAIVVAFLCGLIFASGFDLTRFGWAQSKVAAKPTPAEVKPLAETENAFEAIADKVTPAVVSIQTQRLARNRTTSRQRPNQRLPQGLPPGFEDFFRQFDAPDSDQPQEASGSGFIVSKDGYILTNNHVVADMDKVTVGLLDRRVFEARVVGRDPTTDVAVIKIDAANLPVVAFGDDARSRVGQWVLAIGNPLQLDFTVTAGIVSAKGRNANGLFNSPYAITDYIQTDAAINPGNSGGPLVNIHGEVIGINSAIASGTGYYAGYGFAIPITLAKEVMDDIIKFGKVRRAVVGVGIDDVSPADAKAAGLAEIRGAKIGSFNPEDNSPAKKAGVEIGDIIVAVNGEPVQSRSGLQRLIRRYHPGDQVDLEIARFGQRKTFKVKLAEAPADTTAVAADDRSKLPAGTDRGREFDKIGITVEPVTPEFATRFQVPEQYKRGLAVARVTSTGPAYRELQTNDIIVGVLYPTKRDIASQADLDQALSSLKRGDVIEFKVWTPAASGGATRAVSIAVDR